MKSGKITPVSRRLFRNIMQAHLHPDFSFNFFRIISTKMKHLLTVTAMT